MLIDMHVHEKTHSFDSFIGLEEIIERGKLMGLDGVCVTDHESNGLRDKARQVSAKKDFQVFVGAEILTFEGDVLVFGMDQLPQKKMHARDLVELVLQQGGAVICAHPYRQNGRGMGDGIKKLGCLSGVEGLNGSTPLTLNTKACHVAAEMNIPLFGSSDAHHLKQLGKYATMFQGRIRDEKDLVEAILEGNVAPVYFQEGTYHRFDAKQHDLEGFISSKVRGYKR